MNEFAQENIKDFAKLVARRAGPVSIRWEKIEGADAAATLTLSTTHSFGVVIAEGQFLAYSFDPYPERKLPRRFNSPRLRIDRERQLCLQQPTNTPFEEGTVTLFLEAMTKIERQQPESSTWLSVEWFRVRDGLYRLRGQNEQTPAQVELALRKPICRRSEKDGHLVETPQTIQGVTTDHRAQTGRFQVNRATGELLPVWQLRFYGADPERRVREVHYFDSAKEGMVFPAPILLPSETVGALSGFSRHLTDPGGVC
jgi:hypothetical protein